MADVPEHFSDTAQEKSEANDVQIVATQKKKKKKKRKYSLFAVLLLRPTINSMPKPMLPFCTRKIHFAFLHFLLMNLPDYCIRDIRDKEKQEGKIIFNCEKFTSFVYIEIRS